MKSMHVLRIAFFLPILLFSLSNFASENSYTLEFGDGGITFEIESSDARLKSMVTTMEFNKKNNQIDIETAKEILFVEFLDAAGDLIFTVPIGSDNMHIGVSTYPKGVYYIKIMLDGEKEHLVTKVKKEF